MRRVLQLCLVKPLLLVLLPMSATAQTRWLQDIESYRPFIADLDGAQINVLALAKSKAFPYMIEPGSRQVWDITLGKELAIVAHERKSTPAKSHAIAFVIPVSFHMIEDFKDASNPIIDTDYRFSFVLKSQWRSLDDGWSFGGRAVLFGHESTHLGDEFSLHAQTSLPEFERVNVSYEYWQLNALLQHTNDTRKWRAQAGFLRPYGSDGFYDYNLTETNGRALTLSQSNWEALLGLERISGNSIWGLNRFGWFVSADLRPRLIYDYHRAAGESDSRQLSINAVIGLRDIKRRATELGAPDLYLRFYHGVNPHGQFRSQRNYSIVGFGLRVDL